MRATAAIPACGLIAGCAIALAWPELPPAVTRSLLVVAFGASAAAVLGRRATVLALGVTLGSATCGILLTQHAWRHSWRSSLRLVFESIAHDERQADVARGVAVPLDDRASVVLVGVLDDDASVGQGGGVSLRVRVEWIGRALSAARDSAANPVHGAVSLSVGGDLAAEHVRKWRRGRRVRLVAQLRRPPRYLDPGVVDQERALARRGVSLVGSVKSAALVDVVSDGGPVSEAAGAARAFTRRAVVDAVGRWSIGGAAIVTAIVIGDRTGLEPDMQRRLQEAGTYHVIAISGGNIAILAGLALFGFRVAGLLGRTAMLSAIVGLLMYGAIVSGGASVDRATFMAVVYFAGRALDLRGPPMNALALVAALLVAANPLAVVDVGFLLTFGASAAIMAASMMPPIRSAQPWVNAAFGLGLASLAAEAALFPVGAALFSRVTVAGLLLNFIAIPAMAVTQIAGMVAVPLFAVSPPTARFVGAIAAAGAETLMRSAELVDLWPQVTWRVPAPGGAVLASYYAALIGWWTLRLRRHQRADVPSSPTERRAFMSAGVVAALAGIWIVSAPWSWWASRGDGRLHVTFIDVGQGDAALVQFPHGRTMLIDAGGSASASAFDIGDRVVGQVLRTLGIRRLDTLVLTHGDLDHIGGAASVLADFHPGDIWEGIPVPSSVELQALASAARRVGARWTRVQRGDEMFIDDVRLVVKHPTPADWERQEIRNDDSIVIELQWRGVSIVATGDVGVGVERGLADTFEPASMRVVKVPHHGSRTSSSGELLAALRPDVAVISVGRSNTFGHPAPAVLARYEAQGAAVYRTDRDGAIRVSTDGDTLEIRCHVGSGVSLPSPVATRLPVPRATSPASDAQLR